MWQKFMNFLGNQKISTKTLIAAIPTITMLYVTVPSFQYLCNTTWLHTPLILRHVVLAGAGIYVALHKPGTAGAGIVQAVTDIKAGVPIPPETPSVVIDTTDNTDNKVPRV